VIIGMWKGLFCILYFSANVSHSVGQNGSVTAQSPDPHPALFSTCVCDCVVKNAEGFLWLAFLRNGQALSHCLDSNIPRFAWFFFHFASSAVIAEGILTDE
jgi:hypothetical protein